MSFFDLVRITAFKSCILWKRHWFLFIYEFTVPALLFFLLAYGRSKVNQFSQTFISEPTYGNEISDQLLLATHFPYNDGSQILYTPKTELTERLMRKVQLALSLPNDVVQGGFVNEDDLMKYYAKNPNGSVIAVIFRSADRSNLDYVIKIHEKGVVWDTDKLYYNLPVYISEAGSQTYIYKGILALQYLLDASYIEELQGDKKLPFTFMFQEFPYPPHKTDTFLAEMFMHFLPLITIFSFISLCPAVLKPIVEEKQSGSKELLKMVGMKPFMLYIGWFQHALVTSVISVCLIVFFMKVSLFGAPYPPIEYCNAGLYFIFLILYCVSAITFCMLISTFFSRPSIAMVFGILIWILSYFVPTAILSNFETLSWKFKVLMSFLPNMALYFGYSEISIYELREVGLNFQNLYLPGSGGKNDLSFLTVILMFILQTFLFAQLTLYMENISPGPYGIPKKFYYPFTDFKKLIKRVLGKSSVEFLDEERNLNCVSEGNGDCVEEGKGLRPGIEIKHLYKRYGHNMAVNNLSMDIYENQITVLLGHNGAGKTTTMSIITGMIEATSGSVKINGLDIKRDIDQIRKEIGWCPQHNLLFSYFTVFEHMMFFSMLRGWSKEEARKLSNDLLQKLDLAKKRDELASNLSGGMKRKLCLGLALTGKGKVLILDEPTSGMDPESRREVWNMLLELRGTQTILITTHFMEEADVLGDWIAIMANGTRICYGTPMFLKKKYDTGYHLSIMLESDDPKAESIVTNYVTSMIHDSFLKYKNANNLVYVIPTSEKYKFPGLLKALEELEIENNGPKKPIGNMSVNITTLEEVFLKTSTESMALRKESLTNDNDRPVFLTAPKEGSRFGKVSALIYKHIWFTKKKWKYQLVPTLISILIMVLVAYLSNSSDGHNGGGEAEIKFKLNMYGETGVFFDSRDLKNYSSLTTNYKQIAEAQKGRVYEVPSVNDAIIKKGMENIAYYKQHMIVAASFGGDRINVMYSNNAVHGAPISLNLVMNGLIRTLLGPNHSIKASFAPLQGIISGTSPREISEVQVGLLWLILVPIGMLFLMGAFLIFPNKEHISNFSALQFMTGVAVPTYWLTNFAFDFVILFLPTAIILSLCMLVNEAFRGVNEIGSLIIILSCYGVSGLPFTYLFSFKKSISGAFAMLLMTGMFFGVIPTVIVCVMEESQDPYYMELAARLKIAFLCLIPQFGLTYTGLRYSRKVVTNYNMMIMPAQKRKLRCTSSYDPCCDGDTLQCKEYKSYFTNDEFGVFPDILIEMIVPFLIYMGLVIFLDSVYKKKLQMILQAWLCPIYKFFKRSGKACSGDDFNYVSVNKNVDESSVHDKNSLYATNLSKYFFDKQVVKSVTFDVKVGECFGLLGVNGAGKTTTFRMLTNDIISNSGRIGVSENEKDFEIEEREYFNRIGYCPQYDALNFDLSARELLKIMAQLRNFKKEDCDKIADDFLDLLDLKKYASKPCGELSGGNKRKLALALALVGCRPYILLDEPTSGVDPLSRRKIWKVLECLKNSKKVSFVLTSHSMEECEALCEKMAIMKEGEINAKGTIPELKQEYATGFTLKLKLKTSSDTASLNSLSLPRHDVSVTEVDEVDGVQFKNGIEKNCAKSSKSKRSSFRSDADVDEVDGPEREGYDVLKNTDSQFDATLQQRTEQLHKKITEMFAAKIKDQHEGLLHYHITGNERWSGLFSKVEDFKNEFSDIIEDYTISGTSLEDVFLSVARTEKKHFEK